MRRRCEQSKAMLAGRLSQIEEPPFWFLVVKRNLQQQIVQMTMAAWRDEIQRAIDQAKFGMVPGRWRREPAKWSWLTQKILERREEELNDVKIERFQPRWRPAGWRENRERRKRKLLARSWTSGRSWASRGGEARTYGDV